MESLDFFGARQDVLTHQGSFLLFLFLDSLHKSRAVPVTEKSIDSQIVHLLVLTSLYRKLLVSTVTWTNLDTSVPIMNILIRRKMVDV